MIIMVLFEQYHPSGLPEIADIDRIEIYSGRNRPMIGIQSIPYNQMLSGRLNPVDRAAYTLSQNIMNRNTYVRPCRNCVSDGSGAIERIGVIL